MVEVGLLPQTYQLRIALEVFDVTHSRSDTDWSLLSCVVAAFLVGGWWGIDGARSGR